MNKTHNKETGFDADKRGRELEKNAQISYKNVATQSEMLNGGKTVRDSKPRKNADPDVTKDLDDVLYEAAQQGNIGGG